MRRYVRLVAVLTLVGALAVMVASNPDLFPFALLGLLLGIPLLARSLRSAVLLAGVGLVVLLGALILLTGGRSALPYVRPAVPVQVQMTARYDSAGEGWTISERFVLSRAALLELSTDGDPWFSGGEPTRPEPSPAEIETMFRAAEAELRAQDWQLSGGVLDAPVFEHAPRLIRAPVGYFPLRQAHYLDVVDVSVNGKDLSAGASSTLVLVATPGLVSSTSPPSEEAASPDGEVRTIELRASGYGKTGISIETVSPLARFEPLRSLTGLADENWAGFALASGVALLIGIAGDRIRALLGRPAVRPAAAAPPPPRPPVRAARPRRVAGRRRDRAG